MTKETEVAEKYASDRCLEIQKRRDAGLPPYSIKNAIITDFLAGRSSVVKGELEHARREQREMLMKFACYVLSQNQDFERGESVSVYLDEFLEQEEQGNDTRR